MRARGTKTQHLSTVHDNLIAFELLSIHFFLNYSIADFLICSYISILTIGLQLIILANGSNDTLFLFPCVHDKSVCIYKAWLKQIFSEFFKVIEMKIYNDLFL